jgi:hypothetical protein
LLKVMGVRFGLEGGIGYSQEHILISEELSGDKIQVTLFEIEEGLRSLEEGLRVLVPTAEDEVAWRGGDSITADLKERYDTLLDVSMGGGVETEKDEVDEEDEEEEEWEDGNIGSMDQQNSMDQNTRASSVSLDNRVKFALLGACQFEMDLEIDLSATTTAASLDGGDEIRSHPLFESVKEMCKELIKKRAYGLINNWRKVVAVEMHHLDRGANVNMISTSDNQTANLTRQLAERLSDISSRLKHCFTVCKTFLRR